MSQLIFHINFNCIALKAETVRGLVRDTARLGYDAILWEIEDKVRLETCPAAIDRDAIAKDEFKSILAEASSLGLKAIPLLQTFGHAECVIFHEEYAHLRELPDVKSCYCVSKPETREFLKKMVSEYLELFGDIEYFHLGGDEAYHFGKCPICSERNRMELYAEHLNAVSEEIRARGIRPIIWHDMIVKDDADTNLIPRDYIVCDWDYMEGCPSRQKPERFPNTRRLRSLGFNVMFASASQCGGDDPFIPYYDLHTANMRAGAVQGRSEGILGNIVTSWSVRGALKTLQVPELEYAARVFKGNDDAGFSLRTEVFESHFGLPWETVLDLAAWNWRLYLLHGICWSGYQYTVPPPAGLLAKFQENNKEGVPEMKQVIKEDLPRILRDIRRGIAAAENAAAMTPAGSLLVEAAKIKLVLAEAMEAIVTGRPVDYAACKTAERESVGYYMREQPQSSAEVFARCVWAVVTDKQP